MNARVVAAFHFLLFAGCPGGPDRTVPQDIDLSPARALESQGKTLDAIAEYARLVDGLKKRERTDARAHAAWGRILGALHRMKAPSALAKASPEFRQKCAPLKDWCSPNPPGLLGTGSAGHWSQALALGGEPALMAEGAGAIADLLAEKLDDPSLRRGRIGHEGELAEPLYRRCLAQAAAEYSLYALRRSAAREAQGIERTALLFTRAAKEIRGLAALRSVHKVAADRWAERASEAEALALALKKENAGGTELTNELRQSIETDTAGLLKTAIDDVNKANDLLSRRADEGEILEALERALRNFVAGRECLVEPSPIQKRTLDVMPIAADALRSLAFEK